MDPIEEEDSSKVNKKLEASSPVPKAGGGLLDNVSLLTTGASSLLQFTNERNPVTAQRNNANKKEPANQKLMDTSTPARAVPKETIMYGFDLSPVHSYEYKPPKGSRSHNGESINEIKHSLEQDKLEDAMFHQQSKPAPNFMQARSISSPHQSRISMQPEKVLTDDTETMMSQVYSSPSKSKKSSGAKRSGAPKKKSSPSSISDLHPVTSPRKSGKRYAHVRSSGYGISSLQKKDKAQRKITRSSPAPTFSALSSRNDSGSGSHLFSPPDYAKYTRQSHKHLQEIRSPLTTVDSQSVVLKDSLATSTNDMSVQKAEQSEVGTMTATDVRGGSLRPDDTEAQVKFHLLQMRCKELKEECDELREKNSQINRENFVLSAKLNKLMGDHEDKRETPRADSCDDQKRSEAEVERLKKDLLEQEHLIKGYQTENERMYQEFSKMKVSNRENEAAMYQENLKLKSQLASLKEELVMKENVLKEKNRLVLEFKEERTPRRMNQSTQTEEGEWLTYHRSPPPPPCQDHLQEIADLRRKVEELESCHAVATERDVQRLQQADADLALLKSQVARMKKELLLKNNAKRESQLVQDLRRQVKEQEQILMKRQNPDNVQKVLRGDNEIKLWKERAEKLERSLKEQEENSAKGAQTLQKMFSDMKVEYENRVNDLSAQLDLIKQHSRKFAASKQQEELVRELEQTNASLRLEVEALRNNLMKDRSKHAAQMTALKKRLKVVDERVYLPSSFATNRLNSLKDISNTDNSTQTHVTEARPQVDLTNEVMKWKQMYDEVKAAEVALKKKHETEVDELRHSTDAAVETLKSNLSKLEKKEEETKMSLVSCQAEKMASQAREKALQLQIKSLLDELVEVRNASPNAAIRQLASLQSQVRLLSVQHHAREQKLNTAMSGSADGYMRDQVEKLQTVVTEKNMLLSKFRYELDSILDVLEKQVIKQSH